MEQSIYDHGFIKRGALVFTREVERHGTYSSVLENKTEDQGGLPKQIKKMRTPFFIG